MRPAEVCRKRRFLPAPVRHEHWNPAMIQQMMSDPAKETLAHGAVRVAAGDHEIGPMLESRGGCSSPIGLPAERAATENRLCGSTKATAKPMTRSGRRRGTRALRRDQP